MYKKIVLSNATIARLAAIGLTQLLAGGSAESQTKAPKIRRKRRKAKKVVAANGATKPRLGRPPKEKTADPKRVAAGIEAAKTRKRNARKLEKKKAAKKLKKEQATA